MVAFAASSDGGMKGMRAMGHPVLHNEHYLHCKHLKQTMAAALDVLLPKPLSQPQPSLHLPWAHLKRIERQNWGQSQCRNAARLSRGGVPLLPLLPPAAAARAGGPASLPQADDGERQRTALLDWLVRSKEAEPSCLKVERRWRDEAYGYCLVASADIEPEEVIGAQADGLSRVTREGMDQPARFPADYQRNTSPKGREPRSCCCELHSAAPLPTSIPPPDLTSFARMQVILSVPLTAAITSEGADESHWSAAMAGQLLQRRAAAQAAATAGDAAAAQRAGQPWLDALPAHVDLPWLVSCASWTRQAVGCSAEQHGLQAYKAAAGGHIQGFQWQARSPGPLGDHRRCSSAPHRACRCCLNSPCVACRSTGAMLSWQSCRTRTPSPRPASSGQSSRRPARWAWARYPAAHQRGSQPGTAAVHCACKFRGGGASVTPHAPAPAPTHGWNVLPLCLPRSGDGGGAPAQRRGLGPFPGALPLLCGAQRAHLVPRHRPVQPHAGTQRRHQVERPATFLQGWQEGLPELARRAARCPARAGTRHPRKLLNPCCRVLGPPPKQVRPLPRLLPGWRRRGRGVPPRGSGGGSAGAQPL